MYDNTVSAREHLSYIAEQAGGFACIGRDGKLYIRSIGQDTSSIDSKLFKDFAWGEQYKISRVAYEDGVQDFKFGNETNNTLWINSNNMYVVDSNQVENIYALMKDFESHSFEGTTIIDPAMDLGDIVVIDGKKVVYQGDLEYSGKFVASMKSTIQSKEKEETTRTVISTKTQIRRVQSEINQIDGIIRQVAQEQNEQGEKISKQEITIDGITQEVSKKVGEEEIGTKIEQNAESVRIAWNNISEFIQFIQAGLYILGENNKNLASFTRSGVIIFTNNYNNDVRLILDINGLSLYGDSHSSELVGNKILDLNKNGLNIYDETGTLLKRSNSLGDSYYDTNTMIGRVGTNSNEMGEKGLVFNLLEGKYMLWSYKKNPSDTVMTLALGFYRINTDIGIYLGTNFYSNGNSIFLDSAKSVYTKSFTTGAGIITENTFYFANASNNTIASLSNYQIDFYKDLDMHNFSINNVDNFATSYSLASLELENNNLQVETMENGAYTIETNVSDARLKKDIQTTKIRALDVVKKIPHREFYWKQNNEFIELGYIAQELEKIDKNLILKVPQLNQKGEVIDYRYQVSNKNILPYTTKAIQELSEELEEYKNITKFLLNKLNLKEEYNKLKTKKTRAVSTINNEDVIIENKNIKFNKKHITKDLKKLEEIKSDPIFIEERRK